MILTSLTPVKYPNWIGNRQIYVGTATGPSSYNQTTGDVVTVNFSPFNIDAVLGVAVTTDNSYIGIPVPIATGNSQGWTIFWFSFVATVGGTPAWTALGSGASIATKNVQLTVVGGP
jgi:hypothetical protein